MLHCFCLLAKFWFIFVIQFSYFHIHILENIFNDILWLNKHCVGKWYVLYIGTDLFICEHAYIGTHCTDWMGGRTGDPPPGDPPPPHPVPLPWEPHEVAVSRVAMNFLLEARVTELPRRLSLRVEKPELKSSSTQQL